MPTETLVTKLQYVYDPTAHDAAVKGTRDLLASEEALLKQYKETGAGGEQLAAQTAKVSEAHQKLAADMEQARAKAELTKQSMGAIAAGLGAMGIAAGGALALGTDQAAKFAAKLAETSTLSPEVAARIGQIKTEVLSMAAAMGQNAVQAADGLYSAISAGIDPAKAGQFLEVATKAAVGGATTVETAVDGMSTAINAWKMDASEASRVADVMFQGVNVGKMTFEELSASMFQAAPIAASLGVNMEEVVGATATLTQSGAPASVAMTQVRSAMVALVKPNADMVPVLEDLARRFPEVARTAEEQGISLGEAALRTMGFHGAMGAVRDSAKGMGVELVTAMGRVEGANAVLGITGENAEVAGRNLELMYKQGASANAYAIMTETLAHKQDVFRASLQAAGIAVGDVMQPALMALLDVGNRVLAWFNGAGGGVKTTTAVLLTFAAVLGTTGAALVGMTMAFGPTIVAAGGLSAALGVLGGTAKTLLLTLGPYAAIAAAAAAAIVLITKANADYNKSIDAQIGKVDAARASLADYQQAARQGMGTTLDLSGGKSTEAESLKRGAAAYLELSLGVDKATTSSAEFKRGIDELTKKHQAGTLTAEQYQTEVTRLADGVQRAAGGARVLTSAETEAAAAWRTSAEAMVRRNDALYQALSGDKDYQQVSGTLAAAVAKRELTEAQATKQLDAYVEARSRAIEADKEAATTASQAAVGQTYSRDFASQFKAGSVTGEDAEALAADAEKAAADGTMEILGTLWDAQKQYHSDLAEARAADAAAAAKAMSEQGAAAGKLASVEADYAAKRAMAEERLGKAKTDAQRMSAQRALDKANEGYAAAVAKETEHQAKLGNVITAGGAGNVARVEQQYQALVKAQQTALAQMAIDYVKQQVLIGNTSEETAKRIFGSLSHAFPGVEVINPVEEATLGFLANLHEAAAGSDEALQKLPSSVATVTDQMQATADASKAQAAQWNAEYGGMADSAEASGARRAAADTALASSSQARAGAVQGALDIERQFIEGTAETDVAAAARRTAAGAKLTTDVAAHSTAIGTSMTSQRGAMNQTANEAEATGARTASAWGSAAGGVAGAANQFAAATGGMRSVAMDTANAVATMGTKGTQGFNQLGAAAVEAYAQQGSAADTAATKARTADQIYADQARRVQEHGSGTASAMSTAKRAHEDTASATSSAARTAEAAMKRQKAAVDALAAAYRKLPKAVVVKFTAVGIEAARKAVASYMDDLKKIPRSITTVIKAKYESGSPPATDQGHSLMLQHDLEDVFAVADEHGPIDLSANYQGTDAATAIDSGGTLGITRALAGAADQSRKKLLVTMDADGDPLIMDDGSGRMVWEALVEDFYKLVEQGPSVSAGWQQLIDIFFSPNAAQPGSFAHMIASWDPSKLVPDAGLIGLSKERVMEMFALGPEGLKNDELAKWGGEALLDFFNDPGIKNAAERINLANEALAEAQRLIREGDFGGATKKWKEAYDIAKKAEEDYHNRVQDHLKRTQEIFGETNTGRIGAIVDAEDRRHELAMQNLDAENDGWERMGANWAEFEEARKAALEAARTAIKDAQKAQEDGEKGAHDAAMQALDAEAERRQRAHEATKRGIEERKEAERDAHEMAVKALADQAAHIKALQDADDDRIDSMKQGIADLKIALDLEGENAKLARLKDAASEFKSLLGKLERVETDPKKANEAARKAALERVRLTTDAQKAALRKALSEGRVAEGDDRAARLLAEGYSVRARDAERIMANIQAGLDAAVTSQQGVIDAKQAEVTAAERVLELEERAAAKRKEARDAQLEGLDALRKAEDERNRLAMRALEDQGKAEDRRYSNEKQAIDDLKKAEKARHDARIKAIQDEYAFQLLALGRSQEEVQRLLDARAEQARAIADEANRRYQEAVAQIETDSARLAAEGAAADIEAAKRVQESFAARLRTLRDEAVRLGGEAGAMIAAMIDRVLADAPAAGATGRAMQASGATGNMTVVGSISGRIGNAARDAVVDGVVDAISTVGNAWGEFVTLLSKPIAVTINPVVNPPRRKNDHGASDEDFWRENKYGDVRHHFGARQRYLRKKAEEAARDVLQDSQTSFTRDEVGGGKLPGDLGGRVTGRGVTGAGAGRGYDELKAHIDGSAAAAAAAGEAFRVSFFAPMLQGLDATIARFKELGITIGALPPGALPPGTPGPRQPDVPMGDRVYNQYGSVNYFNAADAPDEFIEAMLGFVGMGSAP